MANGDSHASGTGLQSPSRLELPPGLEEADLPRIYELMVLARAVDERMWVLNRAGVAAFVISGQGHEAAQAGAAFALQPGRDILVPYYRDLTISLHFGLTPRDIFCSLLGKEGDPTSRGRQMPAHYGSNKLGVITGSSPVGTQYPQAVGIALAKKLRGEDGVAWTSIGEGGTSQGDWHEALNFAAVHKLPVVFTVENNGWAISVPQKEQMAVGSVADRAAGYGMPGVSVDGSDPLAVYAATHEAVERARRGEGPSLIEARVSRLTPHSSDDDDRTYRPKDELQGLRAHDPNTVFRARLVEHAVLSQADDDAIKARVRAAIDEATEFAENNPYPDPATMLSQVYADDTGK
jgi:2-oxoisovalerate dehydrogenase E1 component alpha subunit